MLQTGVPAEDSGIIGLGTTGEKVFGRRHFSDLVAAFSSPLLLTVSHGVSELGTVHPTSLARERGETAPVLLLGGRSWKVADIDWPRRRVSVVPAEGGGRSRWVGAGRTLSFAICQAEERIVVGTEPTCHLSRRANKRLAEIRGRLVFVDGQSLPLVSDGVARTVVWHFAGGLVSATVARALAEDGIATVGWDEVSVTARSAEANVVAGILARMHAKTAHPALPKDLYRALKFGLCLPSYVGEAVIAARTTMPEVVAHMLSRNRRAIVAPEPR
jgi:ATP-dependent Lhr-like helicase